MSLQNDPAGRVPPGTVVAFAGPTSAVPAGWAVADGRTLDPSNSQYKALYMSIGTTYGGDGITTFALPDYRNMFLRGTGSARQVGSSQGFATALPTSGWKVSDAGSHNHYTLTNTTSTAVVEQYRHAVTVGALSSANAYSIRGTNTAPDAALTNAAGTHSHGISGGDSETRPANVAVQYIIKL